MIVFDSGKSCIISHISCLIGYHGDSSSDQISINIYVTALAAQDRKPLKEAVPIPQSLHEQATAKLEELLQSVPSGETSQDEIRAQIIKVPVWCEWVMGIVDSISGLVTP